MTNEEHWMAAKQTVAEKYGYVDWADCKASIPATLDEVITEAASIMADAIRGEYEAKVKYWKDMAAEEKFPGMKLQEKDKEIAELKGLIESAFVAGRSQTSWEQFQQDRLGIYDTRYNK